MTRSIVTVHYRGKRVPVSEYLETEHRECQTRSIQFQRLFVDLEVALSALLHSILNGGKSQVPYAIYYSATSIEARGRIVQNALLELISEKREALARLGEDDCWAYIFDKFRKVREMRNALAHGHPQTLIIRNKPYVRVVPPVFDVIQISRKIAKRQIPGLKSTDIAAGLTPIPRLIDCFDCINRIVADAHGAGIPWSDRVHELEVSLTALRSLYPDGQKPPET